MHIVTGRWKLGLALALTTAVFWGMLPLALKLALSGLDAVTIVWYRFAVSGAVLGAILAARGGWPRVHGLGGRIWLVLAITFGGLLANYLFFMLALKHTTPAVVQVVIQLGQMFFLLGGLILFKEHFTARQRLGFAILAGGLLLFFNRRLPELFDLSAETGLGVALTVLAAITWAAYGLGQKQLLKHFSSQQILLFLYLGASIALLPAAAVGAVGHLTGLQAWALAFSCANTLIAYGAFAEALVHWEVSRVSAVLALTPLFTIATGWLAEQFFPGLMAPERLNALSICGALLVVAGSALCALSATRVKTTAS